MEYNERDLDFFDISFNIFYMIIIILILIRMNKCICGINFYELFFKCLVFEYFICYKFKILII